MAKKQKAKKVENEKPGVTQLEVAAGLLKAEAFIAMARAEWLSGRAAETLMAVAKARGVLHGIHDAILPPATELAVAK